MVGSGGEWEGSIALLDRAPEPRELRAALARAVSRWPGLREAPGRSPSHRQARPFELDFHLRWEELPDEDEMIEVAARRFVRPFDRGRPPWEVHVLASPSRAALLVKLGQSIAERVERVPLLGQLAEAPDGTWGERDAGGRSLLLDSISQAGESILGALRLLQSSAASLRESTASLVAAGREIGALPAEVGRGALRLARRVGATIRAPLANPLPSAILSSLAGPLQMALVDLPIAALDAARTPFGLELDDVLLSIASSAVAKLQGTPAGEPPRLRALLADARGTRVVLPTEAPDPVELAHEARLARSRARRRPLDPAQALGAWSGGLPARIASRRSYDLSVRYDANPLAGRAIAGARILRVYPIDATPAWARLAIGAQRHPDGLAVGLTFPSLVADAGDVVSALERSSAEFVAAARSTPPPSLFAH